ncbi:MAG TPA: flagellar basal-body rod protein FlgF [Terracidiphilus sp.]|jgi:flagellar basal-body rod protein FlgF/flagellar basal-body rod protein FlgG
MDSGLYAAAAALVSRTQELDTIANNLANASTVGYRAQQNVFGTVLAEAADSPANNLNHAVNQYGILSGTTLDLTQGALQKTGNDLDLAVQGPGYFVVQTAGGPMYTRNGAFQVSSRGELVTSTGDQVLGDQGPVKVLPGSITVSPDGTISSNGAITGKIKLVEFPQGTRLTSVGNVYYSAPANTQTAATKSDIRQGMLESSNVNPITGMVELVNAQRSAEMMQRALSMFNSEIDKTAAQDLPRVS